MDAGEAAADLEENYASLSMQIAGIKRRLSSGAGSDILNFDMPTIEKHEMNVVSPSPNKVEDPRSLVKKLGQDDASDGEEEDKEEEEEDTDWYKDKEIVEHEGQFWVVMTNEEGNEYYAERDTKETRWSLIFDDHEIAFVEHVEVEEEVEFEKEVKLSPEAAVSDMTNTLKSMGLYQDPPPPPTSPLPTPADPPPPPPLLETPTLKTASSTPTPATTPIIVTKLKRSNSDPTSTTVNKVTKKPSPIHNSPPAASTLSPSSGLDAASDLERDFMDTHLAIDALKRRVSEDEKKEGEPSRAKRREFICTVRSKATINEQRFALLSK